MTRPGIATLSALLAALVLCGVASAHAPRLEVVASGLDNPRGLDIGRWGALYVTEAGRGGEDPAFPARKVARPAWEPAAPSPGSTAASSAAY